MVRALGVVDPLDQLGNQEVEVEIALAVAVRAHVDGGAVDERGEIGAVVKVEPAQEVLVGFAVARMLRGDQAGHVLGQLADARQRTVLEIGIADHPFRAAAGASDEPLGAAVDDDLVRSGRGADRLRESGNRKREGERNPRQTWHEKRVTAKLNQIN